MSQSKVLSIVAKSPAQKQSKGARKLRRVNGMHAKAMHARGVPSAAEIAQMAEIKAMVLEARSALVGLRQAT